MLMQRSLIPSVILLVAIFFLFEYTSIDMLIQEHFYDFKSAFWMIDKHQAIPRLIFYSGIKNLIFLFGIIVMLTCLLPLKRFTKLGMLTNRRRELMVVFATLITAPSLVALSKATTNVHCPYQLTHFGGRYPYRRVLEAPPSILLRKDRGRGFPAGHASGGFALMSLAGIARTRRGMALGIGVGLVTGSAMGIYQTLNGSHFLSHTLITAVFCWIVFLLWKKLLNIGSMHSR
jgi:membrane-associated PAP2 superfamily phosphatase